MQENLAHSGSPGPQELWHEILGVLVAEVDEQVLAAYLQPLRPISWSDEARELVLGAPSRLVCKHVETNYGGRIIEILEQRALIPLASGGSLISNSTPVLRIIPDAAPQMIAGTQSAPADNAAARRSRVVVVRSRGNDDMWRQNGSHNHYGSGQFGGGSSGNGASVNSIGSAPQNSLDSLAPGSFAQGSFAQSNDDAPFGQSPFAPQASSPAFGSYALRPEEIRGAAYSVPTNINSRYTFADFVVGNNNQFCHAAAMRVAEQPGKSYNPLFIYGGVGLGKTHLLHAIGNAVLQTRPGARVLYMSSEMFTNELIQALRNAKMEEFKRRLRTIEVLLIDDIQFISGKERTQEEFFHTFNTLYSAKHQIVITSDKIPTDIPGIEERLQTRFSWGLTADLQAPDYETRVAILRRKAFLDSFFLPEEVAHFIAERVSSNVRELEGALTRIHAVSSLQNIPLSLEMAKVALKHLLQPKTVHVSVDDIKRAVATHFNVKISEIVSKRRTKNLSFPRHIAMYLCRKHTTASYPEIGGHFGGRDHSSVIHAANVVASKVGADQQVRMIVEEIERALLGS